MMNKRAVYLAKLSMAWLIFILALSAGIYSFLRGDRQNLVLVPLGAFSAWLIAGKAKQDSRDGGIDADKKGDLVLAVLWLLLTAVALFLFVRTTLRIIG